MTAYSALAIEAATDQFGIAASFAGRVACWESRPAREESQRVYEHCERLLAEVGGQLGELDFVAFGCGPGSFTGVRVAAAAAQAVAFARRIPVCRVSSLMVQALGAYRALGAGTFAVCFDARMQRAYVGLYRVEQGSSVLALHVDAMIDPATFIFPRGESFVAIGDGWQAYPQLLARHGSRIIAVESGMRPSARDLLELAGLDFAAGRTVSAGRLCPNTWASGRHTTHRHRHDTSGKGIRW